MAKKIPVNLKKLLYLIIVVDAIGLLVSLLVFLLSFLFRLRALYDYRLIALIAVAINFTGIVCCVKALKWSRTGLYSLYASLIVATAMGILNGDEGPISLIGFLLLTGLYYLCQPVYVYFR